MKSDSANKLFKITSVVENIFGELYFLRIKNKRILEGDALSKNPFQIILPCHRVIQTNGAIGGYQAGVVRKKWLIQHETSYVHQSSI